MRLEHGLLALGSLRVMFLCIVKQIVTAARVLPMLQTQAVIVCLFGALSPRFTHFPFQPSLNPTDPLDVSFLSNFLQLQFILHPNRDKLVKNIFYFVQNVLK